jgi:biopolymer transport protein ExbD
VRFARHKARGEATIDFTAMLDVTFNLVLFFAVSTNFAQTQQTTGFEVDLPRSSAEAVIQGDRDLDVWVGADGTVRVDEQPVDADGLRTLLTARAKADPTTLVILKADEGVSHGRVVAVMDLAKSLGLQRLAIATKSSRAP